MTPLDAERLNLVAKIAAAAADYDRERDLEALVGIWQRRTPGIPNAGLDALALNNLSARLWHINERRITGHPGWSEAEHVALAGALKAELAMFERDHLTKYSTW
jgi:hypothetical protein